MTSPPYDAEALFAAAYAYSPLATDRACSTWCAASASKQQSFLWDVADQADITSAARKFLDLLHQ